MILKKILFLLSFLFCQVSFAQTYTFTTAGASGPTGPTQGQINTAYVGTTLDGQVTVSGGIQNWTVSTSGLYTIDVIGASGGNETQGQVGGLGAQIIGELLLNQGDVIQILVGQAGMDGCGAGGGGGGTFVVRNGVALMVAGGGGGSTRDNMGADATTQTSGTNDFPGGTTPGGMNGSGGQACNVGGSGANHGGGGGGFSGDGATSTASSPGEGGKSFLNGGSGGTTVTMGGFGGGGGATSCTVGGGGGGGYSGGAGGQQINYCTPGIGRSGGGGGGSINTGLNQINTPGVNTGHGLAVLTLLSTGAANDLGVISIDSPTIFCPGPQNVVVTVNNFGANQVTSATVNWSVDGALQTPTPFSGLLDTAGGTGSSSAQVPLGSFNFSTNSPYDILAWTSNPNGVTDTVPLNDTTSRTVQSSLPAPTAIMLTSIAGNQATLSWTGGPANSWLWENVPAGNPFTGPGTPVASPTVTIIGLAPETDYEFRVREVCPTGDTSAWTAPFAYRTPFFCPLNSFCFLTGGQEGRDGPDQNTLNAIYAGSSLAGQVTSNNGIQQWTVPASGLYEIEAYGAQGGGSLTRPGGQGARMKGEFLLTGGTQLNIVVGQTGLISSGATPSGNRGGGGGSFVWNPAQPAQPIIAAGGGGGSNVSITGAGLGVDAVTGPNGTALADNNGTPGINGNGAMPGGAGFLTDASGGLATNGTQPLAAVNGATGGEGYTLSSHYGGFGSGGGGGGSPSTTYASGGGGGYSGGAGQNASPSESEGGGGGGSFNAGTNQDNTPGVRSGPGVVIFKILSTGATDDIGVISLDSPTIFCPGPQNVVATINNFGANQVSSATVNWTVDGALQTPFNFAGLLDTAGGTSSSSAQVSLGAFNFSTNNPYNIQVWTSNPNGMTDTVPQNDSISTVVQSSLPPPSGLTLDSVRATLAGFSWSGGANNSWLWIVVPAGTPPTATGTASINPFVVVTPLTPATDYDFWVREVCPTGDTSNWAGPINFQTPCVPSSLPFLEDFNGLAPNLPVCWGTNDPAAAFVATGCPGANGDYIEIEGVAGTFITSPVILMGGQTSLRVQYRFRAGSSGCGETPDNGDSSAVEYFDGTNWVRLVAYNGGTSGAPNTWTDQQFTITSGLTNQFQLRIVCPSGSGAGTDTYHYDDFNIRASPDRDLKLDSITGISSGCGLSANESFLAVITNEGANPQDTFDIEYRINAGPWIPGLNIISTLVPGQTQAYNIPNVDLSNQGTTYNIEARVVLPNDEDPSNDVSPVVSVTNLIVPVNTGVTNDEVCQAGTFNLAVSFANAGIINWYDNPGLTGPPVNTGTNYSLPATATVTFYVQAINAASNCPSVDAQVTGTLSIPASPNFTFSPVGQTGTIDFTNTVTGAFDSLRWLFGDGDSSNVLNPSHTYATPGTKLVQLTAYEGSCSSDTSIAVVVVISGINELSWDKAIKVFPNPSEGAFEIMIPQVNGQVTIQITNAKGEQVYFEQLQADGAINPRIGLQGVAAGSYLIRITSGEMEAVKRITIK